MSQNRVTSSHRQPHAGPPRAAETAAAPRPKLKPLDLFTTAGEIIRPLYALAQIVEVAADPVPYAGDIVRLAAEGVGTLCRLWDTYDTRGLDDVIVELHEGLVAVHSIAAVIDHRDSIRDVRLLPRLDYTAAISGILRRLRAEYDFDIYDRWEAEVAGGALGERSGRQERAP